MELDVNFSTTFNDLLHEIKLSHDIKGLWHPLGFITLTLQNWHNNERLRLHIWHNVERRLNQGKMWIHNHEYNIVSLVLCGEIVNKRYQKLDCENGKLQVYNVIHKEQNSDLIATDYYCDLELTSVEQIKSGQFYSLNRTEFHSSEVSLNDITATLVLNIDKQESSPQIIGNEKNNSKEYIYKREYCHPKLLNESIDFLIRKLKSE